MRVLILGGAGMLGHKLWQIFRERFDTQVTLRASVREYADLSIFDPERTLAGVDAMAFDGVERACGAARPAVVVNCIGVIKQLPSAKDPIVSLTVNSLLPHRLAHVCRATDARLIHVSTDCVFSGRKGHYTEADTPDADDLYGRTKLLGEPLDEPGVLTLRTSIIGRELRTSSGLAEWFLSHRGGKVRGYTEAVFSGLTTLALGRLIGDLIERHPRLSGLYHVSSEPISKYDLLYQMDAAFDAGVAVEPFSDVRVDRSLDSRRFWTTTGLERPDWPSMVREMAADPTPYDEWRRARVS